MRPHRRSMQQDVSQRLPKPETGTAKAHPATYCRVCDKPFRSARHGMPAWIDIVGRSDRCHAGTVHLPDRSSAAGVLPQNVRPAVAVEIAGGDRVPAWIDIVDWPEGGHVGAVHLPDRGSAAGVLPQNVRLTVTVEVAGVDRVPARIDVVDWSDRRHAGAVHLPDRGSAAGVLPQNVRLT